MPPFQDLAYELDDVVIFREFYEGENFTMFYHINLTTKTKGQDGLHSGVNNLFFAEVRKIEGENDGYVLNCLCMVNPTDNGISSTLYQVLFIQFGVTFISLTCLVATCVLFSFISSTVLELY